ncbi:MAG: hypothetical protein JWP01_378 [Myxococcales bacterium]|nr:hypothetical protein [Myxococcales bacterium]
MRLAGLLAVVLAACTPEIAPGAYLCGPDQACPDDLACDGASHICVLPSQVTAFACAAGTEAEPNNGLATAQPLRTFECVSQPVELVGCAEGADSEDWYQFDVPATCTTVGVGARLTFPLAFEVLGLELVGNDGATIATGTACPNQSAEDGDEQRCLEQALVPGGHYAVRVLRSGEGSCDGACSYNRYTLSVRLETP